MWKQRVRNMRISESTASCQKFNLEKGAKPLGDVNFQRACLGQDKQRPWDSKPSI